MVGGRMSFTQQEFYWDAESQQYLPAAKSGGVVSLGTSTSTYLCPDLLRLSDVGAADNWRGHVVRGFFRVLGWVTGV